MKSTRHHKIAVGVLAIGFVFIGIASYLLWDEVRVLRERDKYYESILLSLDSPDPMEVISPAKNFFALQPKNPDREREKKVLEFYEPALGRWVSLNVLKSDEELNFEITAFQKTAENLRKR